MEERKAAIVKATIPVPAPANAEHEHLKFKHPIKPA